jgi:multidrug efflux pump subunit AcrB
MTDWIKSLNLSFYVLMAGIVVLYLFLGCVLDAVSMMVLTMPILAPLMLDYNMSLVWFGVVVVVMMSIGTITPPLGLNCFVMKGALGDGYELSDIFAGCLPFVVLMLGTVALFIAAIMGFGAVQQQFFPDSTRPELIIDLRMTEGASFAATDNEVKKLEAWLQQQSGIDNSVAYIGNGSPRFYLPQDQQLPQQSFAQLIVLTANAQERERLRLLLIELFNREFPALRASVLRLENGPPVGFPVQFRVSGPATEPLRDIANKVATVMRANPHLSNVQLDWDAPIKVVQLRIDQPKARLLGVSSVDIANLANSCVQSYA